MKQYTSNELRRLFLDFFASKGHDILESASLIPVDDATLLWINAGMAPLKPYFSGHRTPANPRMANSQKCIRTNDIENVGRTTRHHTFFEMLGNFSIGDYFKQESLVWGWEFLTQVIGFPQDKMYATVHPEDDEARRIWVDVIGMPPERVVDCEDNFWDIGPGPCGPNSEMFIDRGPEHGCGSPDCSVLCDCDRHIEVWNHVFSQFNHNEDGTRTPLPMKNIDTGMGFERLVAIVQGVESNYATDIFRPIMQALTERTGLQYAQRQPHTMAFNVIADHLRTITFAISEGAMPSNEGRGYVLRRLLRRAVRFGKTIGLNEPFLHTLVGQVVASMGDAYPEITAKQDFAQRVIKQEEERFHETLDEGMQLLSDLLKECQARGEKTLSGANVFRLYDTYGFPADLTEDIAQEQGFAIDRPGFEQAMAEQRQRARAARGEQETDFGRENLFREIQGGGSFSGYSATAGRAQVLAITRQGELVAAADTGQEIGIILDDTVFYAESGGQVADIGTITWAGGSLQVLGCQQVSGDKYLHRGIIEQGTITPGTPVEMQLDASRRQAVCRAHTATHVLHKALQEVLGGHATQAGSLVEADFLRFDFSHFQAPSAQEMQRVEERVNELILAALPLSVAEMSLAEAKAKGATALFGERYQGEVRVVSIGEYSSELCGGTHVDSSSAIGQFRILSESGIGSGLRRIEAVTGQAAYRHALEQEARFLELVGLLKSTPEEAPRRLEGVLASMREQRRELEKLQARLAAKESDAFLANAHEVDGVRIIAQQVAASDMDNLRSIADTVKDKLKSGVIVLGAVSQDKVNLVAMVSEDLLPRGLHAGKIIKEVAAMTGGGGGGRPNMAQAGGKNPDRLPDALAKVPELVATQLGL